jgi:hypothetical protein
MTNVLLFLFGQSWKTTLSGYATAAAVTGWDYVQSSGDLSKLDIKSLLIAIGIAILGRMAKDKNVSNSPTPMAQSHVVQSPKA